jgi:hypothetical protein
VLFPTHLLAGYLLGRRWDLPALWAVVGAALPDVVDKPLAMVGVFDLYQTVGHSLLVFVVSVVAVLAGRSGRLRRIGFPGRRAGVDAGWLAGPSAVALMVGWASHLILDAVHMTVNGRPADAQFLAWPFVRHVPAVDLPPVEFALHYLWTPSFFLEVAMWVAVGLLLLVGCASGAGST